MTAAGAGSAAGTFVLAGVFLAGASFSAVALVARGFLGAAAAPSADGVFLADEVAMPARGGD
jgi:hypothetical protein